MKKVIQVMGQSRVNGKCLVPVSVRRLFFRFLCEAAHGGAGLVERGDWKGIAGVLVHIGAAIRLIPGGYQLLLVWR